MSELQDSPGSALQTIRTLVTLARDGEGSLAIAKTAVKDGTRGLVVRGLSLIQRWNEVRFGEALLQELEEMLEAGKIRSDFNKTDAGASSFREFLEMIGEKPDEERFRAFCALFMSANSPTTSDGEAVLDLELMSIVRHLSAGELHLLCALLKGHSYAVSESGDSFFMGLKERLGYSTFSLIDKNVRSLAEHGLVSKATWINRGGRPGETKDLLTDLGTALRARIEVYNEFKAGQGVVESNEATQGS